MNLLIRFNVEFLDLVGYPKSWLLVVSISVKVEVNFLQETLLKNLQLIWKLVLGSRCYVETFGGRSRWGPLAIIKASRG